MGKIALGDWEIIFNAYWIAGHDGPGSLSGVSYTVSNWTIADDPIFLREQVLPSGYLPSTFLISKVDASKKISFSGQGFITMLSKKFNQTGLTCTPDYCRVDCAGAPDGFCCIDHAVTNRLLQTLQG